MFGGYGFIYKEFIRRRGDMRKRLKSFNIEGEMRSSNSCGEKIVFCEFVGGGVGGGF